MRMLRTTLKALALLGALFLVASCEQVTVKDYRGADAGYALLSISRLAEQERGYHAYHLNARRTDVQNWDVFRFYYKTRKSDYEDDTEAGVVFLRAMEPGDYKIFGVSYFIGITTYSSAVEFSIPFTIRPGETTYLGNYLGVSLMGEGIFGIPMPYAGYFVVTDQEERDVERAKQRRPEFPITKVNNAMPDNSIFSLPYFEQQRLPE